MSLVEFLILLVIAGICGSVAQALAGYSRGGCLVSVAVGLVGALVGSWVARSLGLPELLQIRLGGGTFPILWSIIGGALFVAALGLLTARRPAG
jgi:uncharacterized membrane protein YeaQ/YmgE (transglycosylase-associated protein family)